MLAGALVGGFFQRERPLVEDVHFLGQFPSGPHPRPAACTQFLNTASQPMSAMRTGAVRSVR
jgi:hypothetical protein